MIRLISLLLIISGSPLAHLKAQTAKNFAFFPENPVRGDSVFLAFEVHTGTVSK